MMVICHDTGVTIQYVVIYCNTVSKHLYTNVCSLHPVSVDIVKLDCKKQMSEDRLQNCFLVVRVLNAMQRSFSCISSFVQIFSLNNIESSSWCKDIIIEKRKWYDLMEVSH